MSIEDLQLNEGNLDLIYSYVDISAQRDEETGNTLIDMGEIAEIQCDFM